MGFSITHPSHKGLYPCLPAFSPALGNCSQRTRVYRQLPTNCLDVLGRFLLVRESYFPTRNARLPVLVISEPSPDVQAPQVPPATRTRNDGPAETHRWESRVGRLEGTGGCLLSLPRGTIQNTAVPTPFRFALICVWGKTFLLVHISHSKTQVTSLWYRNKVKTTLLIHHLLWEVYDNMPRTSKNVRCIN